MGAAKAACRCVIDGIVVRPHDGRVLHIAWWKLEPYNNLDFLRELYDAKVGRIRGAGNNFLVNSNGTVSPVAAPHLVLGLRAKSSIAEQKKN